MIVMENSKSMQFNHMNPEYEWDEDKNAEIEGETKIYAFNPNHLFGLRGDSYYHTKNQVFQARTIIPSKFKQVYRFG